MTAPSQQCVPRFPGYQQQMQGWRCSAGSCPALGTGCSQDTTVGQKMSNNLQTGDTVNLTIHKTQQEYLKKIKSVLLFFYFFFFLIQIQCTFLPGSLDAVVPLTKVEYFYCLLFILSGFVDLTLHDQVHLLECAWLEILMIGLVWRSMEHPGKLLFAPNLLLDRSVCVLLLII